MIGAGASTLTDQTVAVTGAGGFIGSALVRKLVRSGSKVRALLGPPGCAAIAPPDKVEALYGEIDDRESVASLLAGAEVVFHLAGQSSVAASFESPAEFARSHVSGTATVLEACSRAGIQRVVHASSAEVYGRPESNPVHEDHRREARSPYAAAKIGAESFVEAYRVAYGLEIAVLRPFSVFGPHQPERSLLAEIWRQARVGSEILLADLRPVRDYVFVDDVVDAFLLAAQRPLPPDPVFNVARGIGVSVRDLAETALRIIGRKIPVRTCEQGDRPARADILRLEGDSGRIREHFGWRPAFTLEDGLQATLASFQTEENHP